MTTPEDNLSAGSQTNSPATQYEHLNWPVYVIGPAGHPATSAMSQQLKEYADFTRSEMHGLASGFRHRLLNPDLRTVLVGDPILEILPQIVEELPSSLFVVVQPSLEAFSQWLDWKLDQLLGPVFCPKRVHNWAEVYREYYQELRASLAPAMEQGCVLWVENWCTDVQVYMAFLGIDEQDPRYRTALPILPEWMKLCPLSKQGVPDASSWELMTIQGLQNGQKDLLQMLKQANDRLEDLTQMLDKDLEKQKQQKQEEELAAKAKKRAEIIKNMAPEVLELLGLSPQE